MNQKSHQTYRALLTKALRKVSTPEKAESSRRYFPDGIHCIGATAPDIKKIIADFQSEYSELTPEETLSLTEYLLKHAEYSEETLLAFGLINKFVKKHYSDELLKRFEFWLEHYTTNWAEVDDLCIKTIYQFFIGRPHLVENTQHWVHSKVSWCRRASNVVWVKWIYRKIGKTIYQLDKKRVFQNCDILLQDSDPFVQKSVGWLLKATSIHYEGEVVSYLKKNRSKMDRATVRYAIEKMDRDTRKSLLEM